MGLVSFLVSANEIAGSSEAVSPAAASVRLSRREIPFPDSVDRAESAVPDVVGLLDLFKIDAVCVAVDLDDESHGALSPLRSSTVAIGDVLDCIGQSAGP
jgi:hypothetical protein